MNETEIRLQKFFTDCGVMSRRAAEAEIEAGHVCVNGSVAHIGMKIDPKKDVVTYQGKRIQARETKKFTYIVLNKPRGYITSLSDPQGRKCVTELIADLEERVYPVGRLDMISEGILLLTNDGVLANRLIRPKHTLPKVYRVKVFPAITEEQLQLLRSPMTLDGYEIQAVPVEVLSSDESGSVLKMTLLEGRNRQIRKMCEQVHLQVKRLNRVSIGAIKLNNLPIGKWRYLEDKEVEYLYKHTK